MKKLISNLMEVRSLLVLAIALAAMWVFTHSGAPAEAQVAPTRFAVVDTERLLNGTKWGKAGFDKILKSKTDSETQLNVLGSEITKLREALKAGAATMSAEQKAASSKQIDDKVAAYNRAVKVAEKEYSDARDKFLADLDTRVMPVVSAVGKEMKLAGIFRKFESGLVYVDDALDITSTVQAKMDAAYPQ